MKNKKINKNKLDSLSIYLRQISKTSLLKIDEEFEICKKISLSSAEISTIEQEYSKKEISFKEYIIQIKEAKKQLEYHKNIMIKDIYPYTSKFAWRIFN